jgi:hypothetical protein
MKNIQNVVIMTDSSNNNVGFLKVIFDDNSQMLCSSEMNSEFCDKANEWMQANGVNYNFENFKNKLLAVAKAEKLKLVDYLYSKALILQIENGFTFQVDLRSKYGEQLLKIIENSIGSYTDEFKSKQIITFFVNIEENNKQKQINCACYNWIWQYIFEDLLFYVKELKQLKENFIANIKNSTAKELEEIEFNFTKENGIKINISKTIQKLLEITSDIDLKGNVIVIPEFVKNAIRKVNRELFKYSEEEEIKNGIDIIIKESWFE